MHALCNAMPFLTSIAHRDIDRSSHSTALITLSDTTRSARSGTIRGTQAGATATETASHWCVVQSEGRNHVIPGLAGVTQATQGAFRDRVGSNLKDSWVCQKHCTLESWWL